MLAHDAARSTRDRLREADELVDRIDVERHARSWLMLVIAHRGASAELPENTLPAFERAIELGADFVELDVHADGDGRLVVTHDPPRARRRVPDARGGARPAAAAASA